MGPEEISTINILLIELNRTDCREQGGFGPSFGGLFRYQGKNSICVKTDTTKNNVLFVPTFEDSVSTFSKYSKFTFLNVRVIITSCPKPRVLYSHISTPICMFFIGADFVLCLIATGLLIKYTFTKRFWVCKNSRSSNYITRNET